MQAIKERTTWRKVKLGEVADVLNGYAFSSRAFVSKSDEAIPVFKMGNIEEGGGIQWTGKEDYVPENQARSLARFLTEPEDILMCMTDMKANVRLLGYSAFIKNEKFLVNQRVGRIKAKRNLANARFLFYYLNSPNYLSFIRSTARSGVQVNLSTEEIRESPLLIPDIADQKRIADILSAFDDNIELNNKISRTLEQMSQAIFKEWLLKNQNENWETKNVMEIVKRISVGKKYDNKSALPAGKVPILDQGASGYIGYHNDEPGVEASIDEPVVVFTNHTCNYRLMTRPFSAIQNVLPYVGTNGYSTLFVYYLTKGKITMQEYKGHWPEFEQQEFLIPPRELAEEFTKVVRPMVQKMVEVENENQKLAALRDLLLPKLMSGEVRV